jgi:hypothetical protein
MLSAVPLWPLESYYYLGPGQSSFEGVPFLFGTTTTEIRGIPLEKIDRLSVLMAYARAVCAVMVVFGMFFIFTFIAAQNAPPPDDFALGIRYVLGSMLCAGIVAGLLTYCLPFQMTVRERRIRRCCGAVLGIDADPALVREDVAQSILGALADHDGAAGADPFEPASVRANSSASLIQLARVRAVLALGGDRGSLERRTDELLAAITSAAHADA